MSVPLNAPPVTLNVVGEANVMAKHSRRSSDSHRGAGFRVWFDDEVARRRLGRARRMAVRSMATLPWDDAGMFSRLRRGKQKCPAGGAPTTLWTESAGPVNAGNRKRGCRAGSTKTFRGQPIA